MEDIHQLAKRVAMAETNHIHVKFSDDQRDFIISEYVTQPLPNGAYGEGSVQKLVKEYAVPRNVFQQKNPSETVRLIAQKATGKAVVDAVTLTNSGGYGIASSGMTELINKVAEIVGFDKNGNAIVKQDIAKSNKPSNLDFPKDESEVFDFVCASLDIPKEHCLGITKYGTCYIIHEYREQQPNGSINRRLLKRSFGINAGDMHRKGACVSLRTLYNSAQEQNGLQLSRSDGKFSLQAGEEIMQTKTQAKAGGESEDRIRKASTAFIEIVKQGTEKARVIINKVVYESTKTALTDTKDALKRLMAVRKESSSGLCELYALSEIMKNNAPVKHAISSVFTGDGKILIRLRFSQDAAKGSEFTRYQDRIMQQGGRFYRDRDDGLLLDIATIEPATGMEELTMPIAMLCTRGASIMETVAAENIAARQEISLFIPALLELTTHTERIKNYAEAIDREADSIISAIRNTSTVAADGRERAAKAIKERVATIRREIRDKQYFASEFISGFSAVHPGDYVIEKQAQQDEAEA